jgi:hypothetical protein
VTNTHGRVGDVQVGLSGAGRAWYGVATLFVVSIDGGHGAHSGAVGVCDVPGATRLVRRRVRLFRRVSSRTVHTGTLRGHHAWHHRFQS